MTMLARRRGRARWLVQKIPTTIRMTSPRNGTGTATCNAVIR